MRTVFSTTILLAMVLLARHGFAADAKAPAIAGHDQLIANLTEAFNGESNAKARYLAFAEQADKEDYGQVASLFRAAAKAEGVHAAGHEKVLKQLGESVTADIKTLDVKSTKENLEAALKGERYERDKMYPDFIAQAKQQKNSAALRTFTLAKTAEAEHAKLYESALKNLENWKVGKKTFYVCNVCGYTVEKLPASRCPSCREPVDEYEKVD